jgi:hypothetical protein
MHSRLPVMSPAQLERLRVPAALLLIVIAAFVFWPRGSSNPAADASDASPSVVIGQPGGEVIAEPTDPTQTASPEPIPTVTPASTPSPTPAPTATPAAVADGFAANLLACRSISGSTCEGELGTLPASASSFTALVLFSQATAGDQLTAVLDGPSGTIVGSPYSLPGGGDGYFWAQFQVGGLPSGDYVVTALRNGQEVATTGFRKAGG